MANRTINLTDDVIDYVHRYGVREHPVLAKLRERTAPMEMATMQIGPDQGAFMALLVKLIGAKRILEIGTFTGYSSTAMALALPPTGISRASTSARSGPISPARPGPMPASPTRRSCGSRRQPRPWRRSTTTASISPSSTPTSRDTTPTTRAACGSCVRAA